MSLYNMMNGYTQSVFFILPMLGKHPNEYPRFRDCYAIVPNKPEYDHHIFVYTRTGGGNRDFYTDIDTCKLNYPEDFNGDEPPEGPWNTVMTDHPNYVTDYDDEFDRTYAYWVFSVPEQWEDDYNKVISGDKSLSDAYVKEMCRVFPKLEDQLVDMFISP